MFVKWVSAMISLSLLDLQQAAPTGYMGSTVEIRLQAFMYWNNLDLHQNHFLPQLLDKI